MLCACPSRRRRLRVRFIVCDYECVYEQSRLNDAIVHLETMTIAALEDAFRLEIALDINRNCI